EGKTLQDIVKNENILPITNKEEIRKYVLEIMRENEKIVEDYRKGKEKVFQFLIGQAMAKSKGRLDPDLLKEVFIEELKNE
ncbi:MAG: Asp-tRNA(Asn)/Glu-tRNA(Gln) amidotransferase GatCAB subunit B, partial [Caldisericia bacterium]|nr:Asp-tRNA(Asn)/Glu-tRNA(Gln) amidotransferase GatCAB subunit B [Caldisericia bacterium]